MSVKAYTRVCDLGSLPTLVAESAGPGAVRQIFQEQEVPVSILDRADAPLLSGDCLGLYRRAADTTGQPDIGLQVGAQLGISDLGLFGRYVSEAPTLGNALVRSKDTIRFHETCSDVRFEYTGKDIRFIYQCCGQSNVGWRQRGDVVVCVLIDIVRCYLGPEWVPNHIEVSHRSGARGRELEDHFGVPVLSDRTAVAIVFNKGLLGAAQIQRTALPVAVTRADVVRQGATLPPNFVGMAAHIVHQRLLMGRTDLEGAAAKLGIGTRTFQRRLNGDGLSYNRLLSKCLKTRAADLLAENELSVADIADVLGYSSQTHFTRAFKRWAGVSPGKFRASAHEMA